MDLTSKRIIKNLLKKYQTCLSKRFGQNFLIDKKVIKKIITTANLGANDIILEIGPAIGNLTIELAKKVKRVVAVEKDPRMAEILKETLKDFNNVEIIQGDILKSKLLNSKFQAPNPRQIPNSKSKIPKNYKVVANLPYYIVAPVIRKFLETENQPKEMVLMVQKEVAQRICAKPPKMSILAVSVQFYAKPEIISFVSKKSFWPSPKVDGAIIKIIPKKLLVKPGLANLFFRIVRAGFSQPRKQILNNLSNMLKLKKEKVKAWLLKNNIQPNQRAETLIIEDWIALTKNSGI